jgi:Uncharacterized protein containing a von Willebrand factor type A (vWA) domain
MKNAFHRYEDFLNSPLYQLVVNRQEADTQTHRILKSSTIEGLIYEEVCDDALQGIVERASEKLETFPALCEDVFQSLYSLNLRYTEESARSSVAQQIHAPLLEKILEHEKYPATKEQCSGKELPAMVATKEFAEFLAESICNSIADDAAPELLEKKKQQQAQVQEKLADALEQRLSETEEALHLANQLAKLAKQTAYLEKQALQVTQKASIGTDAALNMAFQWAQLRATETTQAICAWGQDPSDPEQIDVNTSLLKRLDSNSQLMSITRHLGRMMELFQAKRRNGYAYGLGEKYSIELGNKLPQMLSSEYGLLALPETQPLFVRKYQQKQLKQYKRRQSIYKGCGDIIFCKDESSSMEGDRHAWASALALTMLRVAASENRRFALIHFSGRDDFRTDIFEPGQYSTNSMIAAAELFLRGGTDYETPLNTAIRLMVEDGFEQADVVFVTDGACSISEEFAKRMEQIKAEQKFKATGILIDEGDAFSFSLEDFCDEVHRLSEITSGEIEEKLVG